MNTNTARSRHRYITLSQVAELYFLHAENFLQPETLTSYKQSVRQFVTFAGDIPIEDLTDLHVLRWMRSRLSEGKRPNTVRGDHRRLSAWLTWASDRDRALISRNWAKLAKPPAESDDPGRAITLEHFQRMLAYCKGSPTEHRDRALLWVLWDTGMRIGEAAKLTIENLHISGDNPLIELPAKITKTNHARVVAVEKACVLALNDYLILDRKPKEGVSELFISQTTGRGFHYETGKHLVREMGVRAGVTVGAHDFRRAFVCRMQEAGMSDSLIMQLTGHRTERMLRTYGRPAAQQNAILAYRRAVG